MNKLHELLYLSKEQNMADPAAGVVRAKLGLHYMIFCCCSQNHTSQWRISDHELRSVALECTRGGAPRWLTKDS